MLMTIHFIAILIQISYLATFLPLEGVIQLPSSWVQGINTPNQSFVDGIIWEISDPPQVRLGWQVVEDITFPEGQSVQD